VSTTTATNGTYTLTVDPTLLPTPTTTQPVVLTINVPGYQASVQSYTTAIVAGGTYGPTQAVSGSTVALTPVFNGQFSPTGGSTLVQLGDADTSGSSNSQFQAQLYGPTYRVDLGSPATSSSTGFNLANYTKATITVQMRGLEINTSAYACADTVTFYQSTASDGTTASTTVQDLSSLLVNSPTDGSLGTQTLLVPNYSLITAGGGDMWLQITAGVCSHNGSTFGLDNFEFVNVVATFTP
jgi:hypothetical protein